MSSVLYLLIRALGALPIKFRRRFGFLCGYLAYYLSGVEGQVARLQISKILKSEHVDKIAPKVFANLGVNFMEDLNLDPILDNPSCVEIDNPDALSEYSKNLNPKITITAHLGNWDLLAAWLIRHAGQNIITAAKPAKNRTLHDLLIKIRDRYGIKVIWRNKHSDRNQILNAISSGSTMGVLLDQDTKVYSCQSKFMGLPCKTPCRMVEFGLQKQACFYAIFLVRLNLDRYKLFTFKLDGSTRETVIQQYHQQLENLLKQYPEQWVWMHKRWRTAKADYTFSRKEYLKFLNDL